MRSSPRRLLAAAALACALVLPGRAFAQVPVQGQVRNSANYPIPGLTVSLVHPVVGRSYPAITNEYGVYAFFSVPVRPDPYYLEVYWGPTLVYRQALIVNQPLTLAPITLR
jgi:hypothetical protein